MTLTLFGGMLLIAALFFAMGLAHAPVFWRGVISGVLPTLGMIGYSMRHWPGGDVMAMHLTLYLATAALLSLAFGKRQGNRQALHWAPVAIIIFFVLLSGLMAAFLSISSHGLPPALAKWLLPPAGNRPVYTAFSGEVPHDEEAAKAISQQLKRVHQHKGLGWRITVTGLDDMRLNEVRQIVADVVDARNQPLNGAMVQLSLSRPGAGKAAAQWRLHSSGNGRYETRLSVAEPGQWVANLSVAHGEDKFETAKEIAFPKQ